jgi:type I restriction enzyme S subunit
MKTWRKIRLGDFCVTNTDAYSLKEQWEFVNYLDTGNITDNRIDSIQRIDLTHTKLPSRARRKVKKNSIVYSTVRPNQRHFGIIKTQPENFLVSTGFAVIDVNEKILDADFLYYMLTKDTYVEALHAIAEQSTSAYPSIKPSDIEDLEITIPDLAMQKTIADVLISLDSKIAQNTKINENLEEQAQAIVENYCKNTDTKVTLGSLMNFVNGFAFKSSIYLKKGTFKIITIKNVQDGQISSQDVAYINEVPSKMKQECFLSVGDVLLSLTGNVGRVGIVCEDDLLLNQRVAKIMPFDIILLPYLYFFFRLSSTKAALETIAKGTAQLNLSPIETLKLNIPYDTVAKNISLLLKPFMDVIVMNQEQTQTLSTLRDVILPKLMSGELDVSDIDL